MAVKVSRKVHFNAAHRLHNSNWSDVKNKEVFGLCSKPNFHGHNYDFIVSVEGEVNPETGFVMDMKNLKNLIYDKIEKSFDHKNLNIEVPEFRNLNPTAENICIVIWEKLRPHIALNLNLEVVLYETPHNFVTYKGT